MATATGNISISTVVSADGIVECKGIGPCFIEAQGAFGPVTVAWSHGKKGSVTPIKDSDATVSWTASTSKLLGYPDGAHRVVRATISSATAASSIRIGIQFGKGEIGV